ncbi:MAG: hypothetical protein U0234_30925 [Sandaracinus sp.]
MRKTGLRARIAKRYLDLLCSVYLYNEHRGYTGLDRILEAIRSSYPEGDPFIARVEKHRADEHKHYVMFRRWFERRGEMPYAVDKIGQIDEIIQMFFGREIDDLEPTPILASEEKFAQLCRAIALTERRGMRQVEEFLASPLVRADDHLVKIFKVIERDEPSHWEPYEEWLDAHGHPRTRLRERLTDSLAHAVVVAVKFPRMLASPRLRRRTDWPDEVSPGVRPSAQRVAPADDA